jgi:OOP family OmpA-OmpF porin
MKNIFSVVSDAKISWIMLFAFFLFLPLSARADVNGGSVEISPFLGYNFFQPSQNLNNNLLYGGRISYNFDKFFGLEGTLEFDNTSVYDNTITGNQEGQFRFPINNVNIYFYNLDAVFNLMNDNDFTLFVLGGFGAVNYNPSIESGDMSTFDLGVGAKYWLSDNFGLRVDIRDNMVTEVLDENTLFQNYYQDINTTIGVVFAFWGEPEKKEAAKEAPAEVIYVAEEPKVEEKVAVIAAQPPIEAKTVVLAFEDVHFYFDKSTISDRAKEVIKKTILTLNANPKAHIRIAGYTSAAGTDEYNQALSVRRAKAVEDYLVEDGLVSKDRLSTIGFGDTRPEMHEVSPSHHYSTAAKANMRVLFEVIVKSQNE